MKFLTAVSVFICSLAINARTADYESNNNPFIFEHTVNRLFSTSTYRVLRSFDFAFTLGSNFNDSGIENFNSGIGIGFGNFMEFYAKTVPQNISSIKFKTNAAFAGIKIKLLDENLFLPGFSVGAGTNLNDVLLTAEDNFLLNIFPAGYNKGLRKLTFNSVTTKFYGIFTKRIFGTTNLNIGVSYDLTSYNNLQMKFADENISNLPVSGNTKILNYFGGLDFAINGRTKFIVEIYSGTNLLPDIKTKNLNSGMKTTINAGMRTFFNEWFTADYGLTYIDTFDKWEQIQLHASITAFFNLGI